MNSTDRTLLILTSGGLIVSIVIDYLKVNKIWARKHIREVSESVSVAAALLGLITVIPFVVKLLLDADYITALRFAVNIAVAASFLLIGIGLWVEGERRHGLFARIRGALSTERGELTNLMRAFAKPREAETILRLLRKVSLVDRRIDRREIEIIESVAKSWGILSSELLAGDEATETDITEVRDAFIAYLDMKPPARQVTRVYDVMRFLIEADEVISREEALILDELQHAVDRYVEGKQGPATVYEVLVVPQESEQARAIGELLGVPTPLQRAGGKAFVAGMYYSELFAAEICQRYRKLGYFSTAKKVEPEDAG